MQNTYSFNSLLGIILVILFFNVAAEIVDSSAQLDETTQAFIIKEIKQKTDSSVLWREFITLLGSILGSIIVGVFGGAWFVHKRINKLREEMQQITDDIRDIKVRIDRITAEMFQLKNKFRVLERRFEELYVVICIVAIVSFLAFLGVILIALS